MCSGPFFYDVFTISFFAPGFPVSLFLGLAPGRYDTFFFRHGEEEEKEEERAIAENCCYVRWFAIVWKPGI